MGNKNVMAGYFDNLIFWKIEIAVIWKSGILFFLDIVKWVNIVVVVASNKCTQKENFLYLQNVRIIRGLLPDRRQCLRIE